MIEKNLESVFKEALGNYEADVDPALWQSVQSGLAAKGAAVAGSSAAGKLATGLGWKAIVGIASGLVVAGTGLYFALKSDPAQPVASAITVPSNTEKEKAAPVVNKANTVAMPVHQEEKRISPPETPVSSASPFKSIEKTPDHEQVPTAPMTNTGTAPQKPAVHDTPPANPKTQDHSTAHTADNNSAPSVVADQAESKPDEPVMDNIENYLAADQGDKSQLQNIFTPNGDGNNDLFTLKTHGLKSLEVTIFNTKGLLIYKWNGLDGSWNGLLPNGKQADAGSYFYSIMAETLEGKICIARNTLVLSR
jgi:gliding motility-associated-like protein